LAIESEINELTHLLKTRSKYLGKMRLETQETTESYQAMANSMIEKLDGRREQMQNDRVMYSNKLTEEE
jgi:hypothetical protein